MSCSMRSVRAPCALFTRRACLLRPVLPDAWRLQPQRKFKNVTVKAQKEPLNSDEDGDTDDFRQAFVRSFLLGLGAGCVAETLHVASKFVGVVGQVAEDQQLGQLGNMLPSLSHQFAPLFAADHAVAIAFWALFYTMEAGAIMRILSQHGGNHKAAGESLRQLRTIPEILLPTRFALMRAMMRFSGRLQPATAGRDPVAQQLPRPTKEASGTAEPLQFRDGGGDVLEGPEIPSFYPRSTDRPASNVVPIPLTIISRLTKESRSVDKKDSRITVEPVPGKDAELDRLRRTLPGRIARPEKSDDQWTHRTKELLSRRLYLKNMWYAAALSQSVKSKPVGVEILSEKIVLFRNNDGKVVAINDVCPHRGAPLHDGWVTQKDGDACVVCPYHGWAFDQEGRVRDVPAATVKGDWPKKPLVSSYDVVEKGGFVWLFNGSKSLPMDVRPPIPYSPELDDPQWKAVYGEIEFECGHFPVFENAIDMAHIHYLHSDSFGNEEAPTIREMKAERSPFHVSATFSLTNKPVNALWEWSKVPEVHVTAKAFLPSTSVISFTLGNGLSFSTFVNTVPINDNRSVNRFALVRNLASPILPGAVRAVFNAGVWDKLAHDAMVKILNEDKAMVEQLRPDLLQREVNVKADGVQTAFRSLRQDYINLGYGVLPYTSKDL